MNKPLVSIVVPVYNIEQYVSECLDSVVSQDYGNIQVIIVNDGSTDNGGEIARRYAADNSNFTYIETKNSGLSSARNRGLEEVCGRFVLLLDGDDYLEPQAVSRCVSTMLRRRVDIVFFSSSPFLDGSRRLLGGSQSERDWRLVDNAMSAETFLISSLRFNNYMPSVCLYMFDRRLIKGIDFLPGILHEDNLFTAKLLLENGSVPIAVIPDALFNRRVRPDSITTMKKTPAHAEGFFAVAEHLLQLSSIKSKVGLEALSWLAQFCLKEALSTTMEMGRVVPVRVRMRAMAVLRRIPFRCWRSRYALVVVLPELMIVRPLISGWRKLRSQQ